jgi:hypothetical protein
MITADQIVAHLVGDYILQSDWMANEKTKKSMAALAHVLAYSVPFIFLRPSFGALVFIAGTHFVIDRWRLARFVCWTKNYLAPKSYWFPWVDCAGTGYHKDRPAWLSVWLMIVADNTMHLICNGLAFRYFQ